VSLKKTPKPILKKEKVIETADDAEVNKYMNIGEDNVESSEDSDVSNVVEAKSPKKGTKSKDDEGDFDNLEDYSSSD
jgi:hypothetical protein